jgi:hypothetical protein
MRLYLFDAVRYLACPCIRNTRQLFSKSLEALEVLYTLESQRVFILWRADCGRFDNRLIVH